MDSLPSPQRASRFGDKIALVVLVPLLVVFVGIVSTFYVTHFTAYVDGDSMEPNLHSGEVVLVMRGYDVPSRGDVIVVRFANGSGDPKQLVKRVIALPGEEVKVDKGRVTVNGGPELGDYTVYVADADLSLDRQIVPEGAVFLLGDNRPISEDSRVFGMVSLDDITGRVIAVIRPFADIRLVD